MRIVFLILFVCFGLNPVFAQEFLRPYDRQLDSVYRLLLAEPESLERQQAFFEMFPKNFEEFEHTYGYNKDYSWDDSMYVVHEDHLFNGLDKLDRIKDTVYYSRLIELSIGGKWQADAINILQKLLREHAKQKPGLVFYLLSAYSEEKVYSFWYFYFNSLLPSKEGIPACFTALKGEYPEIYRMLERAFKDADGQAVG